jgi:hypothetical protein
MIRTIHGGTMSVMPEGITLNYLTATTTPLSFHTFTPPETAAPAIESDVIEELRSRRPDRVAVVSRDVTEYGYHDFGSDYDRRIGEYLRAHYRVERSWIMPQFKAILFRRGD